MSLEKIVKNKGNRRLLIEHCKTTGNLHIYTDDFNYEYFKEQIIKYKINNAIIWKLTDIKTKYMTQGIKEFELRGKTKYRLKSPQRVDIIQQNDKLLYIVTKDGVDNKEKQYYADKVFANNYEIDGYLYNRISDNEYALYEVKNG